MVPARLMQEEYRRQLNRINANHDSRVSVIDGDGFLNEAIDAVFENIATKYQLNTLNTNHLRQLEEKRVSVKIKDLDKDSVYIEYPENFYFLTNQIVKACKKDCDEERTLDVFIIQSSDLNQSLKDPNWKPSFEWEQTIGEISGNKLIIYHLCDFDIKEIKIDYLRKPQHIATPSLIKNGAKYVRNGNLITSDINFEIDSTFIWRMVVELAVLNTCSALGDNIDYQREINRIMTLDKIFIN